MVETAVLQNADDALIVWSVKEKIDDCVGFALYRRLEHSNGMTKVGWVDNFVGFEGEDHGLGERRPSPDWPFQGFSWTDHAVSAVDRAAYQVIPVLRNGDGT